MRRPNTSRSGLSGVILLAVLGVLAVSCARQGAEEAEEAASPRRQGHDRMVAALREVAERARDENRYLGDAVARRLREELERLPEGAPAAERWRINRLLGVAELKLGNERAGIARLTEAYGLLREVSRDIGASHAYNTVLHLAVGFLRLGETENCCARRTPESCILPLRDGAVHTRKEGSQSAIRVLQQLLEVAPRDSETHLEARWLLNLAFMTLGEYPHGVPEALRIPPDAFESPVEFPRFRNVAQETGLDSFNVSGGVVIDDLDGDHDLDVLTSTWDVSGQILYFRNEGDGSFTERHREAGLEGIYGGLNLVQADHDNDGDLDVLVLRGAWLGAAGRYPNSLLRNDGGGRFTDVTFEAGLGAVHYPTQTAAWADYDNDGHVDLYIGNETTPGLTAPCQLFRNLGDGTFTDVAEKAGVANLAFTKGVAWGDYDGDRFPDLYVSNYRGRNRLYRNNRDGTFSDVARALGVEGPDVSFPVWFWDFDNDGHLDIFVTSYEGTVAQVAAHHLGLPATFSSPGHYRADGRGGFQNVAREQGLHYPMLPMGSNFGDLDGDGYPDFYLGTGDPSYATLVPNLMFLNVEGRRFVDITMAGGFAHLQKGHAVAFADIDNDGDNDVFEQMGGAYPGDRFSDVLYENPGFANRWLRVRLVGTTSNRAAIGARLRLEVDGPDGPRPIHWTISSGGSFGANPLAPTLGLGKAGKVRSVEVFWPTTGKTQRIEDIEADQSIEVTEGEPGYRKVRLRPFRLKA